MASPTIGTCRLCNANRPLVMSHIIPAFVFRWQKRTGGPIRCTDNFNQRVQDGPKEPWLCSECEQIFSRHEQKFSSLMMEKIPLPVSSVQYGPWLNAFLTSLAWRTYHFCRDHGRGGRYSAAQVNKMDQAENAWRSYLLGSSSSASAFPMFLIYFDKIEDHNLVDLPINWHRFQMRQITLDIAGSNSTLMTYTKFGPFTALGMIQYRKRDWMGVRVNNESGRFPQKKLVLPKALLPFFAEKAALTATAAARMSETQRMNVSEEFERRVLAGEAGGHHLDAILADANTFGIDAVIRR